MLRRACIIFLLFTAIGCVSSPAKRAPSSEDPAQMDATFEECYLQLQGDGGQKECSAEPAGQHLARSVFKRLFTSQVASDAAEDQLDQILSPMSEPARTRLLFEIVFRSKRYVKHETEKMLALTLSSIRTELQMAPLTPEDYFRTAINLLSRIN